MDYPTILLTTFTSRTHRVYCVSVALHATQHRAFGRQCVQVCKRMQIVPGCELQIPMRPCMQIANTTGSYTVGLPCFVSHPGPHGTI